MDLFFHTYNMRHLTSKWVEGENNAIIPGGADELERLLADSIRGHMFKLARYEISDQVSSTIRLLLFLLPFLSAKLHGPRC